MNANRLRIARARLPVSQLNLALAAGVGPGRYWKLERGLVAPTADEKAVLADLLGLPEAWLWPDEGDDGADDLPRVIEALA